MVAELRGVSHRFEDAGRRREVLCNVDLEVRAGEVVVVLGRSGSGKTTLLNVLSTLETPSAGQVLHRVGGALCDISPMGEAARTRFRRRSLGFVFQHLNLIPSLTVLENATLTAHLNRSAEAAQRAEAMLTRLGLGDRGEDFPSQLSGGEQQRVAVVRALAHAPPLVVADEPTGSLDLTTANEVMALLIDEAREHGAALVVATHHRGFAELGDRTVSLDES